MPNLSALEIFIALGIKSSLLTNGGFCQSTVWLSGFPCRQINKNVKSQFSRFTYNLHTIKRLYEPTKHSYCYVKSYFQWLQHCWLGIRKASCLQNICSTNIHCSFLGGVLTWLYVWGEMQICIYGPADATASLPLTISCSSKSRLVLPFWYQLTG